MQARDVEFTRDEVMYIIDELREQYYGEDAVNNALVKLKLKFRKEAADVARETFYVNERGVIQ